MMEDAQTLRIFLCHSSGDKPMVRELYGKLLVDGFAPWLDEENLLPGEDWREKIPEVVRRSDIVIVCLSGASVTKRGYVQKEIKYALDVADELPENTTFLIPLKLEQCEIPLRLSRWQCVNLFEPKGYSRLLNALEVQRAKRSSEPGPEANENKMATAVMVKRRRSQKPKIVVASLIATAVVIALFVFGVVSRLQKPAPVQPLPLTNEARAEAESLLKIGKKCADSADYDCAISSFSKAIEIDGGYAEAYYYRANAYDERKEYTQALQDYSKAIALKPQYAEAYHNRGNTYDRVGDLDAALADYTKAIELKPGLIPSYTNRGSIYASREDHESAIRDYSKAIDLDPQHAAAYFNRGYSYDDLHRYEDAIKDYTKAIELKPDFTDAIVNRGVVYDNLGKYRQAIKDYTRALTLKPTDAMAYQNRAIDYERIGEKQKAAADWQKYRELK